MYCTASYKGAHLHGENLVDTKAMNVIRQTASELASIDSRQQMDSNIIVRAQVREIRLVDLVQLDNSTYLAEPTSTWVPNICRVTRQVSESKRSYLERGMECILTAMQTCYIHVLAR